MNEIYSLIRKLGITTRYKGYYFTADAVRIFMDKRNIPMKITKDIYPVIARKYNTNTANVEHNIRTMVTVCWDNHKDRLDKIAGYTLEYKPTNSEFIDILAYYLYSHRILFF